MYQLLMFTFHGLSCCILFAILVPNFITQFNSQLYKQFNLNLMENFIILFVIEVLLNMFYHHSCQTIHTTILKQENNEFTFNDISCLSDTHFSALFAATIIVIIDKTLHFDNYLKDLAIPFLPYTGAASRLSDT